MVLLKRLVVRTRRLVARGAALRLGDETLSPILSLMLFLKEWNRAPPGEVTPLRIDEIEPGVVGDGADWVRETRSCINKDMVPI